MVVFPHPFDPVRIVTLLERSSCMSSNCRQPLRVMASKYDTILAFPTRISWLNMVHSSRWWLGIANAILTSQQTQASGNLDRVHSIILHGSIQRTVDTLMWLARSRGAISGASNFRTKARLLRLSTGSWSLFRNICRVPHHLSSRVRLMVLQAYRRKGVQGVREMDPENWTVR